MKVVTFLQDPFLAGYYKEYSTQSLLKLINKYQHPISVFVNFKRHSQMSHTANVKKTSVDSAKLNLSVVAQSSC